MLRACVTEFKESWDIYLPLVEFAYTSIEIPPCEANVLR